MKSNETLEEKAIRCAEHMNEYFDKEDLELFVKWSIQKKYHPYQAMIYFHDVVKASYKWNEDILFSVSSYMKDVENRFYAVESLRNDKENNKE